MQKEPARNSLSVPEPFVLKFFLDPWFWASELAALTKRALILAHKELFLF